MTLTIYSGLPVNFGFKNVLHEFDMSTIQNYNYNYKFKIAVIVDYNDEFTMNLSKIFLTIISIYICPYSQKRTR